MRILHYISGLKSKDLISSYLRTLAAAMEDMAEVRIATQESNLKALLDASTPDIVHVHTCWNYKTARAMRQIASRGIAVVFSPHGGLSDYTMRHEHHMEKQFKRLLYQQKTVRLAEAMVVTTDAEREELLRLGWKKRINVVKSSLLDSSISTRQMAEQMLLFYKKVIDTRYFLLMSPAEKEAVSSLLHVGMAHETRQPLLDSERILNLRSLTPEQWRRILLYADDEDIRQTVDAAAQTMQLDVPRIVTQEIDRFATDHPKAKGSLERNSKSKKLAQETTDDEQELRHLAAMLLNASGHLRTRTLSMRHVAELYETIKYEDFDEDRFAELIRQLGIRKFTERMLQVLQEKLYLEEGFLPTATRNDKGTERLRQLLLH